MKKKTSVSYHGIPHNQDLLLETKCCLNKKKNNKKKQFGSTQPTKILPQLERVLTNKTPKIV